MRNSPHSPSVEILGYGRATPRTTASHQDCMRPRELNALPAAKPHFIEPMYVKPVQYLPEGAGWLYEVKLDGYRCFAGRNRDGVTLWLRKGNVFTKEFPAIARACEALPPGTLVDGDVALLFTSQANDPAHG